MAGPDRDGEQEVREALAARSGRDFVMSARPAIGPKGSALRLLRACAMPIVRRPMRAFGGMLFLAAGAAVAVNALAWQTVRHPSPLFGAKSPAAARAANPSPAPLPLPPLRPVEVAAPAPAPAPVAVPTAPPRPRDLIGEMIRASEGATGATTKADPQRLVSAAQRALAKLGHGELKVDGILGVGTRQAIERFERERKLPVTGELGPRTVRELSMQSGVPIE
jgi:hypothetical protein